MKKKTILIGSIVACFLMLMIPTITAVEYITYKKIGPEINEEELKNAILERIQEMREQEKQITITDINWDDPDGAFEGGLDDYTDFMALFFGIFYSGYFLYGIKIGILRNSENLLDFIDGLVYYGACSIEILAYFGEAFDVFDGLALDNR